VTTTHEPTTAFRLRRAFMEDEGRLRLAWRIALYLVSWWVVFFVAVIVGTLVANVLHWPDRGKNAVVAITAIPLLIGWTWFYRRRVDRRPWRGVGLTALPGGLPHLVAGFIAGTIMIGAWFFIDLALGWVRVVGWEPATTGLPLAVGLMAIGLAGNAGAGFLEEVGYRGYVLQNLANRMPLWAATPLSALLFAIVVHFNKLTPFFAAFATVIGVLFALTRLATGTIWFAIGMHWAFDGTQNYVFGLGNPSPPYSHSLLHLQLQGWLASSNGANDPVAFVLVVIAAGAWLLWLRRRGGIGWGSRLNDEGRVSTGPTADALARRQQLGEP
jgi:membrane protease YdiL (CAAX protease family)